MGIAKSLRKIAIPAILAFSVLAIVVPTAVYATPTPKTPAKIISVLPDRSLELEANGKTVTVKLAGISNVEDISEPCLEEKTLSNTEELLTDTHITFTYAVTPLAAQPKAHLFLPNGTHLNTELVRLGLVRTELNPLYPSHYDNEFKAAQTKALEEKVGLWDETCDEDETELKMAAAETEDNETNEIIPESAISTVIEQAVELKPQLETVKVIPTPTPLPLYSAPEPEVATRSSEASLSMQMSSPAQVITPASHDSEWIFGMINAHRAKIGKPAFVKDERICSVAVSRGPELYNEIFVNRNMHAGFYARNLPYWATENIASYQTADQVMGFWLRSPVHRSAIEGDYTHSCGACYGNSCAQIFTNFAPKA